MGIENQLYNAEIRLNEPSASSTFENTWGNVYTSLKNARVIIGQCQEGKRDEGNLVTRGIAEVMELTMALYWRIYLEIHLIVKLLYWMRMAHR